MKDEYSEKNNLLKLCRDINKGLFSEDAQDDIRQLLILYNLCGNRTDKDAPKRIAAKNKADKKQLLKIVYISFVNMFELDLNTSERLVFAEEILKDGGFIYQSQKFGTRSITMDFLRLAKDILCDEFFDKQEEKKRVELLAVTRKFSRFKIILLNKVN